MVCDAVAVPFADEMLARLMVSRGGHALGSVLISLRMFVEEVGLYIFVVLFGLICALLDSQLMPSCLGERTGRKFQ
jgi:hypothetical protein